jgi:glycosyltransferase involved in cell wall biosynthesis
MKDKTVSLIMPFYNTGKYIRQAVQSIIAQSYQNWELIAVDDGSQDDSAAKIAHIRNPRIKCLANPANLGIGESINKALEHAQGEYFAIMDSDDIAHSDRLMLQIDYFDRHPDVMITGSEDMVVFHDEKDVVSGVLQTRPYAIPDRDVHLTKMTKLLFNCVYKHPTVMIRRSLWGDLRYSDIRYAEDYEMWSRAAKQGRFGGISLPLGFYRQHPGQNSRLAQDKVGLMKARIWKKLLEGYGLHPSDDELEMHAVLSLAYRPVNKEELGRLYNWAECLVNHFADFDTIDQDLFLEIVTAKLFDNSNDSTSLGVITFQAFERWLRLAGSRFSSWKRFKFMAKSLARHGKHAYHR